MPVELTESLQDVVARSKLKNKSCLHFVHAACSGAIDAGRPVTLANRALQ